MIPRWTLREYSVTTGEHDDQLESLVGLNPAINEMEYIHEDGRLECVRLGKGEWRVTIGTRGLDLEKRYTGGTLKEWSQ